MALKERISLEMQGAMKAQDRVRLETLRTLRAALMEKEIELKARERGLTPEEEVSVLMTAAKKRRESIEMFEKGNRKDLVDRETAELSIIGEFLPTMMSPGEIEQAVNRIARDSGATGPSDFGKLMPAVMKELKGRADGRLIQEMVKKKLGK
jgi:uncharacterized protein YqeY